MQRALSVLLKRVASGEDFAVALKQVSNKFKVNPDWLAYEFDRANDDQWR